MIFRYVCFILFLLILITNSLSAQMNNDSSPLNIRQMIDTVGFASRPVQMDELMNYISANEDDNIKKALLDAGVNNSTIWKTVISPHDDYTYVGYLYPALLQNVKAKTIILIGVCHKANLKIKSSLIVSLTGKCPMEMFLFLRCGMK